MTGGGILALVAYGAQNVLLSGNPQMTYFYKAFKRHTHFAMENITIPLEGPNELGWDSPITLRAKIPRYGDLLSDMYFTFQVPDIYSKNLPPQTIPGRIAQWEFQWVRYLGAALINQVSFAIAGRVIQQFDGRYLLTRALLDMDQDTFSKWKVLVGDTPELINPAEGVYAGGSSSTGYPTVFSNPTIPSGAQANRPSILGREIHVPLSFWFTEATSQALPLVGIQNQECEVRITLNPVSQLYTVLDNKGIRVNPTFALSGTQTQTDVLLNNPLYVTANYPSMALSPNLRNFLTDFGVSAPQIDTWFFNPRLQGTFVYLPRDEQQIFATRPLTYLMHQITTYPFPGLFNRQVLDLQTHNPITRLLFTQQRSDARPRNDYANFTNWVDPDNAPFQETPGILSANQNARCSGIIIPNTQREIVRQLRVLCDGNEIQEPKPALFFNALTPYRYVKGIGQDGLLLYSFQLEQNATQPSGSINASRIRNFQIECDVWPLPTNPNYTYDVTIYVESINWLEVVSGMGDVKYAL